MNSYYLTLVLKADLEEKERKALLDSMTKKIVGSEGKIEKEDLWGVRSLAYPIKRKTSGYYAHYEISADPKNAKGLDKTLKVEEDVLRYLLIKR
ncbi:MAG: 30S ribosomal protein S6 [Candidatus Daviesbacteria bacterium]|nr:30S ribosomal protein S6 [Candidatus Daviesbacteria bacterium]